MKLEAQFVAVAMAEPRDRTESGKSLAVVKRKGEVSDEESGFMRSVEGVRR